MVVNNIFSFIPPCGKAMWNKQTSEVRLHESSKVLRVSYLSIRCFCSYSCSCCFCSCCCCCCSCSFVFVVVVLVLVLFVVVLVLVLVVVVVVVVVGCYRYPPMYLQARRVHVCWCQALSKAISPLSGLTIQFNLETDIPALLGINGLMWWRSRLESYFWCFSLCTGYNISMFEI